MAEQPQYAVPKWQLVLTFCAVTCITLLVLGACEASKSMVAWSCLLQDQHQPAGPQDAGAAEIEDDDDDDLFASLEPSRSGQAATQQQQPVSRRAGGPHFGASVFGSITLNMHRAGTGMHVVCTSMASRLERRRSFVRPSRRSW